MGALDALKSLRPSSHAARQFADILAAKIRYGDLATML
jgi:hypothetical protein